MSRVFQKLEVTRSFKKSFKAVKRNLPYFKRARKRIITLIKNFPTSVINTASCIKPYKVKFCRWSFKDALNMKRRLKIKYISRSHVKYRTFDHDNTFTFNLRWQSIFSYCNKFYVFERARKDMWARFSQIFKKHSKIPRKMNFTVQS